MYSYQIKRGDTLTTATTGATTRMISNIEAKVGNNPTANEVWNAVTEIVAEGDKLFGWGDQTLMAENMVIRYWEARGVNTSMPAGHRCHGMEFTGCNCPR